MCVDICKLNEKKNLQFSSANKILKKRKISNESQDKSTFAAAVIK